MFSVFSLISVLYIISLYCYCSLVEQKKDYNKAYSDERKKRWKRTAAVVLGEMNKIVIFFFSSAPAPVSQVECVRYPPKAAFVRAFNDIVRQGGGN